MSSNSTELTPAEKYARAKDKNRYRELEAFSKELRFPLDDFQEKSCQALERGSGVLVAAPTGAGKTIVG